MSKIQPGNILRRSWNTLGSSNQPVSRTIQVLQWNILADTLSGANKDKGGFVLDKTKGDYLSWEYRKDLIQREIFRNGFPDIICLQEVDHFEDSLLPFLGNQGYVGFWRRKPKNSDGVALFYRAARFELTELELVTYKTAEGASGNQVGIVATLSTREKNADDTRTFVVASTHLASTKSEEGEQIRKIQITQLLDTVQKASEKHADAPAIICSDLNAAPAKNDTADYDPLAYEAAVNHTFGVASTYKHILGEEPPYTTWKIRQGERASGEARHTIDYIFFRKFIPLRVLLMANEEDIGDFRLPAHNYPSDHMSLMAEFQIP